jgi:hypothetical protein
MDLIVLQICGDERWANVPRAFAEIVDNLLKTASKPGTAAGKGSSVMKPQLQKLNSSPPNASNLANAPLVRVNLQPSSSTSIAANQSTGPLKSQEGSASQTSRAPMSVFFVVNAGSDNHLAQIKAINVSTHQFFYKIRKEYYRLRGSLRSWFSIWRYSHCDFCVVSGS